MPRLISLEKGEFYLFGAYLVQQGRVERLLAPLTCYGGVKLWKLTLNKSRWERVICRGLSQSAIQLS